MLVDLLKSLFITIITGLLKFWWFWLILIIFNIAIILLKRKNRGRRKEVNDLNKNNKCFKCERYLKKISGKYGLFFGCSNFPKCTYK